MLTIVYCSEKRDQAKEKRWIQSADLQEVEVLYFKENSFAKAYNKALKSAKHEVIVFHVTDKQKELDFNFEDRPYKFVDLETGATLKLNPFGMRDLFRQKATEFSSALKTKCLQHKIDLVEADISAGLHQVLLPYLVKRAKLYAGI